MPGWRSHLHENGPRLVCALLIALMVLDCARVIALSVHENRPRPEVPRAREAATQSARLDPQAIMAAHLFGVVETPALDPATARPATADLQLHGTFATVDPRQGWAIMTADGSEKLYGIGEQAGGAALRSVYADHVLLDRDGQLESLWLPHAVPVRTDSAVEGTGAAPAAGARRLADIMRAEADVDEESQTLIGFRIAAVAPASGLLKAGLRPYDVVTAVNGTPLTDQDRQRSRQILDAALASGSATLGILRGSVHLDVSVELPH